MISALKLARMNKGLTQVKVAEIVGVHRSVVCNVELRRLVANEKDREAIAAVVGGKASDFFDEKTGLAL